MAADAPSAGGGPLRPPVVVGLGNPGPRYAGTRHNAGFLVADELAGRHGGRWKRVKQAEAASVMIEGRPAELLKPRTYMNESGRALGGYRADELIVVHDDLDLDAGVVRVKVGGGAGGHNGLRSIIARLGRDFVRVRIGVGRPPAGVDPRDYVLSKMDPALREAIPRAADAVEAVILEGPEAAMNRFNVRVRG
ncbi:aminoacyl-tRNA hydrolase [Rubrobacter taiwanensis]|uniref:Peptidyl-tRNA hydrolase n=1 Tax=Rubrobacter taiwanensis TaxID=185139 RepID=A0A4R1BR94_9ACTN|nr:aminoacyl-tRNA hydrolase [Rubrobacter taiwanensis]TCJ20283.1 aminoacyl-tRNA hydrolase [Rubrobacter taiwanensis]